MLYSSPWQGLNSSEGAPSDALISVDSPADRRAALAIASLRAARLRVTSRGLLERLVGGWVRCMMYRRPTVACFAKVYRFIHDVDVQASSPDVALSLSRGVADELVVAGVPVFIMATNLKARLVPKLYATDASLAKRAIVSTPLSRDEAALVWRCAE